MFFLSFAVAFFTADIFDRVIAGHALL